MTLRLRTVLILGALLVAMGGAALFFLGEFHRLSAVRQHPGWVYAGIGTVRDAVISVAARDVELPTDFAPRADPEAATLYQAHCAQCHGAPGIAPDDFALGMMPVPSNLAGAAKRRPPEEIYWLIRNGMKMSGMPPWVGQLTEEEMWRLTAMVESLPLLSPVAYRALLPSEARPPRPAPDRDIVRRDLPLAASGAGQARAGGVAAQAGPEGGRDDALAGADPARGRAAMQVHACRSCHEIPGMVGRSDLHVGPDLGGAGARRYIAGVLPNTPANMVRWIMDPQAVDPLSAMPDLGVPQDAARDMAAYLYTLSATATATETELETTPATATATEAATAPAETGRAVPVDAR